VLRHDAVTFILSIFFAEGAFKHVRSPAELWRLRIPHGKTDMKVPFEESHLQRRVFRMTENQFNEYMAHMSHMGGFLDAFTTHSFRRQFGSKVDSKLSASLSFLDLWRVRADVL
jgi:hypothetical protein